MAKARFGTFLREQLHKFTDVGLRYTQVSFPDIFYAAFSTYIDFLFVLLYTTSLMNIRKHERSNIKIILDQDERALLKDASFRYMNTYAMTSPVLENEEVLSRDPDAFKLATRLYPSLLKASSTDGDVNIIVSERHIMSLYQIALYNERCTIGDLALEKNPERFDRIRAVGNFCIELADNVLEHFDNQDLNDILAPYNK